MTGGIPKLTILRLNHPSGAHIIAPVSILDPFQPPPLNFKARSSQRWALALGRQASWMPTLSGSPTISRTACQSWIHSLQLELCMPGNAHRKGNSRRKSLPLHLIHKHILRVLHNILDIHLRVYHLLRKGDNRLDTQSSPMNTDIANVMDLSSR